MLALLALNMTDQIRLESHLEADRASGRLGVMHSPGTDLDVLGHLVVVARGERLEVAEPVEGDGILWGREADGSGVTGDRAGGDVVGGLTTHEEAVAPDDGVGGEGGALRRKRAGRVCRWQEGRGGSRQGGIGDIREHTLKRSTVALVCKLGCL